MGYSPTIVAASLSDKDLKDSIDKLVRHVEEGTQKMVKSMDNAVEKMKKSLQSLGDVNINSSGASDGGASRRAKAQNEETKAIEQNIAKRKEQKVTLDQIATATARVTGKTNDTLFTTMSTDIGILKERLNSAHSQFSSFIVLAKHAQQVGDKGLFQFATENLHSYEEQVRRIITAIRGMNEAQRQMKDVVQPQGHSIQNFVKDLLNTTSVGNTALREMGDYYRRMERESKGAAVSTRNYSDEIKTLAAAIRSTTDYASGKSITVPTPYGTDIAVNIKDKVSIEEKLLDAYNKQMMAKSQLDAIEQTENTQVSTRLGLEKEINSELEKRKRVYKTPETKIDERFRQLVAKSIGVDQKEIIGYTTRVDKLSASLKQLQSAYNHLTSLERNSPFGRQLREDIQQTSRHIDRIKKEMTRPVDLRSVIKLPTNTLDEINYKIRQLQSYSQGIRFNTETGKRELKELQTEIDNLRRKQTELIGMNNNLLKSNTALGRSWNYMKNRLAFYFTVGASTQFVKNLIEVRSQYEMNERALGILINSAERGTQIFQELSNMALVSPYTLIELSSAAKQLTAYDVAARDVVDTTRRLADMAAAVGIPIDRLTYALGQIKAYGYLNSRDARMFANAGIPLVKSLADHYTELEGKLVSTADIYDRIKKKAIGYNDVMQVVAEMTDEGGKFFDFQAKMAGTLKVQLANLTLAWNNMLNDIGKSEQGVLSSGIGLFKSMFANWKQLNRILEDCLLIFGFLKVAQLAYYGAVLGTNKAIALETVLGKKLTLTLKTLGTTMNTVLTSSATWWGVLITAIGGAILSIWRGNEAMKEFNRSLREDAGNTYKDLTKFLEQYSDIQEKLTKQQKGKSEEERIDSDTAKKAWVAVKEQIELSSKASDEYVSKLLSISDISERLRAGFKILEDIRSVTAAIEELNDGGIKLERQWSEWWNLWTLPDGTIGNLKDTYTWLDKIEEEFGNVANARKAAAGEFQGNELAKAVDKGVQQSRATEYLKNYEKELNKFRENLSVTTESIVNFIDRMEWSGNAEKIQETFSRALEKFGHQNNLSNKQMMTVRLEAADAEKEALKKALAEQREIELNTYKNTLDEKERMDAKRRADELKVELDFLTRNTAQSRVYWEDFTKWMGRQHKSEVQKMFRGMSEEQIRMLDLSRIDYSKWITELAQKYAKEHGWSYEQVYNQLKSYIFNANQWSIRIPLIISSEEGKSVYETLTEADTAIDTAYKKIQRLRTRQEELNQKGGVLSADKETADEATRVIKEISDAQNDYNRALEQGGHSKKEDAAAKKAQNQAESELQKALKEEIALIDKTRSVYKSLTKEGVSSTEALDVATKGYGKTVTWINSVLEKHGIAPLDITKYAGVQNPAAIMQMLQEQMNALVRSGSVKPEEIKDLEVKLKDLKVDSVTFDHKTVTESLNNELSKLKDEYELSVELDANPELGDMFANMMGLSAADLAELPKDFEGVVRKMQAIVDDKLGQGAFDVSKNLNKKAFDEYIKNAGVNIDSDRAKQLKSIVDFANEVQQKETKKQIDEWKKLLEKYAEYEYKKNLIAETAQRERATARKKGASIDVFDAIDIRERQETAKIDFEYFQKTPEWIAATGNLATLSHKTISVLIEDLEEYRRKSKNLDPKQIKQINKALSNLYKEQRKNNPFKAISNMLQQSREDFMNYQSEIDEVEKEMNELYKRQGTANWNDAQAKKLDDLLKKWKKLKELQEGGLDATTIVSAVNETVTAVRSAVAVFDDLAKAIGGVNNSDIDKVFSVFEKAGQGAAIGAQFGGVGAAIGASVGAATGLISAFADKWSGNESITESIEESNRAIKNLENSYLSLQQAIERAYGSNEIGAKRAAAAAKELQLAELKRQLTLEQSRSSKNRDKDRILDLKKQIKELTYEIQNATHELVDDLLGTDVGGFAENLVSSMITAFKNGEDYMKTFSESFDTMVDNMIMKSIVGRVVSNYLDSVWENVEQRIAGRTKTEADAWAEAQAEADRRAQMSNWEIYMELRNKYGMWNATEQDIEAYRKASKRLAESAKAQYDAVAQIGDSDIEYVLAQLAETTPELGERLKEILGKYYKFGESSDKQLSALQQGISGITENTAGALEAYMNGVSQQVYLQSEYLRQIAVALTSGDDIGEDAKITSLSQILLQLRSSYEIQASINTMLEDIHDSGNRAFRVITI